MQIKIVFMLQVLLVLVANFASPEGKISFQKSLKMAEKNKCDNF